MNREQFIQNIFDIDPSVVHVTTPQMAGRGPDGRIVEYKISIYADNGDGSLNRTNTVFMFDANTQSAYWLNTPYLSFTRTSDLNPNLAKRRALEAYIMAQPNVRWFSIPQDGFNPEHNMAKARVSIAAPGAAQSTEEDWILFVDGGAIGHVKKGVEP